MGGGRGYKLISRSNPCEMMNVFYICKHKRVLGQSRDGGMSCDKLIGGGVPLYTLIPFTDWEHNAHCLIDQRKQNVHPVTSL